MHEAQKTQLKLAEPDQAPAIYDPLGDESGLTVLRSSKLSAADKLAWGLLRVLSNSGRKQIRITPREVGEHQNVTSDAGRQRLKNLKEAGLIHAPFTCPKTGVWTINVLDPLDVLTADLRAIPADPQLVLPFERDDVPAVGLAIAPSNPADQALSESSATAVASDAPSWSAQTPPAEQSIGTPPPASYTGPLRLAAEDPSEEPPEDPPEDPRRGTSGARARASGPSGLSGPSVVSDSLSRPLTIGSPSELLVKGLLSKELAAEEPRRGTSGPSSPPATDEADLAALVDRKRAELGKPADQLDVRTAAALGAAMAFRTPSPAEEARQREQWIEVIGRRVHDRQLKACVKVKVAAAIVAGELRASEIEEVFAELGKHRRAGTLRGPEGIYFLRAAQALFNRHGLDWTGYGFSGRRKPRPK